MSIASQINPKTKKLITRLVIVLAFLAVLITVTQIIKSNGSKEEDVPLVRPVKTIILEEPAVTNRLVYSGRVEAGQSVDLSFEQAGQLIEFPVKEGQRLKMGDLIARIDDRDSQSAYNASAANFEKARADYERYQNLFDRNMISASELETRVRDFNVAAAELDGVAKAVEGTSILAPFDGIVAKKIVDNFQQVQAKEKIVTFQDPTSFDIALNIPGTVLSKAQYYDSVISVAFDQEKDLFFPATVKEFSTVADVYTKTYEATLNLPQPEGIVVIPDMTVTVILDMTLKQDILQDQVGEEGFLLPSTSIVYNAQKDKPVIWTVDSSTMQVSPQEIEILSLLGDEARVNGSINAGDIVVTAGGPYLSEGMTVRFYEE